MENRNLVPMTQLIESISMGPFGSDVKVDCFVETGIPILNGSNLTTIRMNEDDFRFVTREKADSLSKALAHRGDIIVTHRGTLGQLSYVPHDSKYEEYLISQSQFRVTLKTDLVDPVYFAYYFHSPEGQKRLLSFANYVGVPALASATSNFKELRFPLIPLDEQKRIVNKILCLEEKISINNSICSDLESMAKLLYDYWFVQFDFPDENGRPYKSSGGKMVWNEELKREIPEGWGSWIFADHMTSARGVSYSTPDLSGDGIPMLNLANFSPDDSYNVAGIKNYSGKFSEDKILGPYELIMCNTQQTALDPKKDIIGHCLLVPDIFDGTIVSSHHVNHLVFDKENLNYLVYGESKTTWFHKYMAGLSSGTNILGMDFKGVYKYKMVMPDSATLGRYADVIHNLEARKNAIIVENQQLTSLRDFLLPMLMNGQVKVGKEGA